MGGLASFLLKEGKLRELGTGEGCQTHSTLFMSKTILHFDFMLAPCYAIGENLMDGIFRY